MGGWRGWSFYLPESVVVTGKVNNDLTSRC